jgi:hypothetical protein
VDHPARAESFLEFGILGVGPRLRFLLGVEVIKVPEELVEAVRGGQVSMFGVRNPISPMV